MKKKPVIIGLTLFIGMLILCFCAFPIGDETVSETILGERRSQDGKVLEQITQVDGLHNYFSVFTPDGCFRRWRISFYKFYLKIDGNKIQLSHLHFTPQDEVVLRPLLPVGNTTKWVAGRLLHVERDNADVELFVFDEKKMHRKLSVKNCVRTSTALKRWEDLFNYGITTTEGNRKIMFSTKNGNYTFDVINDELRSSDSPPTK